MTKRQLKKLYRMYASGMNKDDHKMPNGQDWYKIMPAFALHLPEQWRFAIHKDVYESKLKAA